MIYDWTDSYYRYLHEFLLEEIARRYDLSYLGPTVEFAMGYNLQISPNWDAHLLFGLYSLVIRIAMVQMAHRHK